ncbi:MAG: ribonuclease Z [Tannerellaceae bacterium]|jgi:ribonuclease Z|nr:ribonuclease Z [Tannerellaceae bacterium]
MADFDLHILGCGSALPTTRHSAASQVINLRDKLYMIDCGEGTQVRMRACGIRFSRLNHIFISHLHGDHCFGLPGLISTLGMLGRRGALFIYGHKDVEDYMRPILARFCAGLPFEVVFVAVDTGKHELIMEDKSLKVYSIPLRHRIPTCGFLFEEKAKEDHLVRDMIDFYNIPVSLLQAVKRGGDYTAPEGEVIPHSRLTRPADPPKRYAYCSDTAFSPHIAPLIRGVDLLYHEATFAAADIARARQTAHSTAAQAALTAREGEVKKLIIGHFSARYDSEEALRLEADSIFPGTILAREGLVVHV